MSHIILESVIVIFSTINESKVTNEENEIILSYDISFGEKQIKDISVNKTKIETLINLCNQNNLSPIHIYDVIDDFLVDLNI